MGAAMEGGIIENFFLQKKKWLLSCAEWTGEGG